ncbi:multidrug transporter [Cupriavidus sp. USMAA2-4]|uniref:efflux transporter outer membrane subunit n=1 Tax=Cupriavidus sp. USMAA2-4 TaxID=876364 RepID=UPI0008A6B182|nr:efflux transporter outer membrane subunit [Cupriavidus sp. USMAA2-4]AOY92599.1 multidrug transporter [Cupriavidus sp. USMAA2-4]
MIRLPRLHPRAPALLLALLLGGCAVGPDFSPPAAPLAGATLSPRRAEGLPARLTAEAAPAAWWRLFGDATLDALQARAQAANLDLRAASARVAQSRARMGIAGAALLPALGAGGNYGRQAVSANGLFAALGAPSHAIDLWQAGFDAAWEIDLWGRARRLLEQAQAGTQAALLAREAVRVSLSAEVARTYLQWRGVQAQLDIAGANGAIAAHALRLAQSREANGVATRFDTAAAQAQLATVTALEPELERQRDALLNALALLLALPPRELDGELTRAMPLPAMPPALPVGLPSELARRRPDILQAEAELHAATAAVGAAQADFYPRLTLKARLGAEAFQFTDLGNWASRNFLVGPTLYLPIFEGGRLKQTLALTEAGQQAAAIAYQKTVLQAWHEIDNALDAWAAEQRRHAELARAEAQNRVALQAAERAWQQGAADYLPVLVAQRNLLGGQLALSDSATTATLTVVALYKALGGGWEAGTTAGTTADPAPGEAAATANTSLPPPDERGQGANS